MSDERPVRPSARGLQRLTVTQWFALVVGVLALVAAAGLLAGLLALARLSDRRQLLVDRIDPANVAALRLSNALLDAETGVRGFVLGGEEVFLAPYRRGIDEERVALRELERVQSPGELAIARAHLAQVRRLADAWRAEYAVPVIASVRAGEPPPPASAGRQRFELLRGALAAEQRDLRAARVQARAQLESTARFATAMFVGAGVLVLLSLLAAALALRRMVIAPLGRLARGVRTVARGDFEHALEPSGPRDVAQLGRDVEGMRERIVAEIAALRDAELALIGQAGELRRSNEELEQFAYVASHDLQEPLRKVASFTQMLERRYKGELDERADRYIGFAVDGAKRMQELINDLLEFSRVGRLDVKQEPVDTNELVAEARARLAAALQETGAEVSANGLPTVTGDAGLLAAVFQNLIANAIKFRADAPPRVWIEAERDARFWRFECTDNGIGVEDQYGERIFVIFQRLHTREAYEGTGIGLAMCRKIIEYHGGRIWLVPAEAGRGARFDFTLPAHELQEELAA